MADFKVLRYPHLGLKLKLGAVYSLAALQKKCGGDKAKLKALGNKILDSKVFGKAPGKAAKKSTTKSAMKTSAMKTSAMKKK